MTKRDTPSTDELVERERRVREEKAQRTHSLDMGLGQLFEMHRPKIYKLCLQTMGDPSRADELVQETLAQAWRKLPDYDGRVPFQYWIYGIARNLCRNAKRKKGELLTHDGVVEATGPVASALQGLRAKERVEVLQEAASAVLDGLEQEAVHLRYVEGMSINQITEVLGLEGSGARALLQRVRRKLGRELKEQLRVLGHGPSLFHQSLD